MADISPTAGFDAIPLLEDTQYAQGRQSGDSVAVGQLETMNVQSYRLANNIEALKIGATRGPRNCVLSGHVAGSGNTPAFATNAGRVVTFAGDVTPLLLSFAKGFTEFGSYDNVVEYTGTANIDYTSASNGDTFMVFALNTAGVISFVSVPLVLVSGGDYTYHVDPVAPVIIAGDQFWYDSQSMKMYREVASAFVEVEAIYLGGVEIVTTNAVFTSAPYLTAAHDPNVINVGAIQIWHNTLDIPSGWLLCNGSAVAAANYPKLNTTIVDTYGMYVGNTFLLPSMGTTVIGSETIRYIIRAY